jgi:hypothetical protein
LGEDSGRGKIYVDGGGVFVEGNRVINVDQEGGERERQEGIH